MEGAERLPCAFCAINREGSCVIIYLLNPPNHPHPTPSIHAIMFGTWRNTFTEPLPPVPLPFAMWKQPFSRGHFLSFHPDAWHSWQIGCGSEGDGLWKQCPCLQPTHCRHTQRQADTQIHDCCACAYAISHSPLSAALPDPWDKAGGSVLQGGDLDVKHTTKTGNLNKSWLPSTWTLSPLYSFVFSTYELHFWLAATFGKIKSRSWVSPRMKFTWNVQLCSSFSTHTHTVFCELYCLDSDYVIRLQHSSITHLDREQLNQRKELLF